jgi:hypothetical protein
MTMQPVRLDFEVRWLLNPEKLLKDPFSKELRDLGGILPYRLYLEPAGELLSERSFNVYDYHYVHEIHFFDLPHGRWHIRAEDLSGWLDIKLENVRLNTVRIATAEFALE